MGKKEGSYSFANGARPRMGKRESVEDAAELDDKGEEEELQLVSRF